VLNLHQDLVPCGQALVDKASDVYIIFHISWMSCMKWWILRTEHFLWWATVTSNWIACGSETKLLSSLEINFIPPSIQLSLVRNPVQ
jgi:hypothetical protein